MFSRPPPQEMIEWELGSRALVVVTTYRSPKTNPSWKSHNFPIVFVTGYVGVLMKHLTLISPLFGWFHPHRDGLCVLDVRYRGSALRGEFGNSYQSLIAPKAPEIYATPTLRISS